MEDKNKSTDDVHQETKVGSGRMLASARKQQNRSIEEIADELNLSTAQIKTIELDQNEGLPEATYVRGYIRAYARLLELDAERVLDNYLNPNWQKSSNFDDMPRGIGSAGEAKDRGFFTPTKVIVFLVLFVSLSFLWYSGMLGDFNGLSDRSGQMANKEVAKETSAPSVDSNDSATAQLTEVKPQNTAPFKGSVEEGSIVKSGAGNELVLSFTQTSWVDVRDGKNNRLAFQDYAKGEQLKVNSAGLMSVFIGNAGGVSALYNGKNLDIGEYKNGIYARFTLGEE